MAPQDLQNCGRNLRKRKQSDAEFAGNSLLGMVIIDIVINVLLGRVTDILPVLHCPWSDDAFVSSYRQDAAKQQTAGIVCTHRPKIRFFAPQGRLVAPIRVKFCSTDGHLGSLGCAKFTSIGADGWECGPQNIKNFHFLIKSRPAGATPLTDFRNI